MKLTRRTLSQLLVSWLALAGCKDEKKSSEDDADDEDSEKKRKKKKKSKKSDDADDEPEDDGARNRPAPEPDVQPESDEPQFTGIWQTGWGKVTLAQAGSKVTGSYTGRFSGSLNGDVTGHEADLVWTQTNGEGGKAKFTLAEDGNSFKGTWGSNFSATNGGSWDGTRIEPNAL